MESVVSTVKSQVFCKDCKWYQPPTIDYGYGACYPEECLCPALYKFKTDPIEGRINLRTDPRVENERYNCKHWEPIAEISKKHIWFKIYFILAIVALLLFLFV